MPIPNLVSNPWILGSEKNWKDQSIPLVICMEATGNYHESCALYLFEKGYSVSVILPNKAKNYLKSLGNKSKNDSIDAKGLARWEQNNACLSGLHLEGFSMNYDP
ncbi:IS110 family transposase [Algoriphagus boritolerans]|uniref:IS110 family transposase n=1 Tax=Algoriphagus boritolerans TaxID=308111 RepID=UPI002FCE2648